MGEALFELEQILRSKQDNMTSQEGNVLMNCKAVALREFTIGAGASAGITWLASRRLNKFIRINLSAGAAIFFGLRSFGRSLDSCIEHILALDGSRMQKELATIMLKKRRDDPWTMQHISKYFYSEKVYDDSSSDQPHLRWRIRNFFGDYVAHSQSTHDNDKTDTERPDVEKTDSEPKLVSMNPGVEAMANPLDCVFGLPAILEEICHSDTSGSPRKHSHSHSRSRKRSHRKHRTRYHEDDSNSQEL